MSKYLDIEKLTYNENIVEVDDDIAETILELNKKGYATCASCSGHSNIEFYPCYVPKEEKEKIVNSNLIIFDEADIIYSVLPSISTHCYVKFNGTYNFENLPDLFKYESAETSYIEYLKNCEKNPNLKKENMVYGDSITRRIDFLDSNGKRKPFDVIEKEIKEANKSLLIWAKSLEPISNKKLI